MELALVLAGLVCSTGIVLGMVFPRLLAVVAGAIFVFVAASFAWFILVYLGVVDVGRSLAAGVGPGSPVFSAVLLAPSALPAVAFVGLCVLCMRRNER